MLQFCMPRVFFFTEAVMVPALFMTYCLCPAINAATITEGPVSVTALIGTNTQFHCAGTGNYLVWEVDGLQADHSNISARGITSDTTTGSSTVQSTLTVPATLVNDGTTVRCAVTSLFSTPPAVSTSNYSTLTVLPGIGRVLNLRFNPSFSQVLWDPPLTAGVLSGLYYLVTLMTNVNNEVVINETTDNTYCPLPALQPCQYYIANVTAFSSEYHGDSVVIKRRTPGEYYNVQSKSQDVVVNPDGVSPSVVLLVTLNLKLPGLLLPCYGQRLTFATYPQSNTSDITTHPDYDIVTTDDILYSITDGIVKKLLYTAVIGLTVSSEGAVDVMKFNFSTFDVQHCDVHTDHTSYILVECTFAINSTAPGFVLIQDEHSQYTINTTLQRHEGDVSKGSVNITDLPTGEYRVTVYDEMEESSMEDMVAYKHPESLQISQIHNPHPSSTLSVSSVQQTGSSSPAGYSYVNTNTESPGIPPTTTPQPPSAPIVSFVPVVVGVVSTGLIITTVVVVTMCLLMVAKLKHRKNSFAPCDHVYWTRTTTESRYVEKNYLKPQKKPEVVYADIQQSTNPPAAPPPTQPVVYAKVQVQQPQNQALLYADVCHSGNRPAAAPPVEQEKVAYAVINSEPTDKATGYLVCTGKEDSFTDGSGQKDRLSSTSTESSSFSGSDHPLLPPSASSPEEYRNRSPLCSSYHMQNEITGCQTDHFHP